MDSLPNLHPALIHFPLALLPAAILLDVVASFRRRDPTSERAAGTTAWNAAAALLHAGAALGALVAYLSGQNAADSVGDLAPATQLAVADHGDAALAALLALAVLATARVVAAWRGARGQRTISAAVFIALALPSFALVMRTANLGGALVFRHGVGVTRDAAGGTDREPSSRSTLSPTSPPVATPLARTTSGGVEWSPTASDTGFLGTILLLVPGSAPVFAARDAGGEGLALRVDGRSVLLLPGSYVDATLEAGVERSGFTGTIGLVMRSRFPADATLFELTPGGAELAVVESGRQSTLGRGEGSNANALTLSLSAAGGSLRGGIDGRTAATGTHSAADGSAGILLDGSGVVRIRSLKVAPFER